MDPIWIIVAFALGFAVKQIGLPPLVGFLAAGFVLNFFGIEGGETLEKIAEFGVLLLLFSIGLKLKIKNLLRPEIWATATLHMALIVVIFGAVVFGLSVTGLSYFTDLNLAKSLLIAFALSFSSTVFAVKILEEKGAMTSSYGQIAIGILIMQDIFAVVYLTFSSGNLPSPWALGLILLIALPRLLKIKPLSTILDRTGHGELLVLLGVLIPFGGAALFNVVGLKPDLGALVFGILLSNHPKAGELSKAMLGFKDLFLVGFFLLIGLSGTPTLEALGISFLFVLLLPIKVALFFLLLARFKLRSRTASLTSFSLANYSEFGLIVGAAGVSSGMLGNEWLLIFAISLSITFVLASPLNIAANRLYASWHLWLQRFETSKRLLADEPLDIGNAEVVVFGMGRVGTSAYDIISKKYHKTVIGIDIDKEVVQNHLSEKRTVITGDATDSDFWERVQLSANTCLIMLATPKHSINMQVIEQLKKLDSNRNIAAICRHDDELEELKQEGVEILFNLYTEAGAGYADHTFEKLGFQK